ncbi:hypothetical protein ACF1AJ_19400 [Leifsonia sp. NPDC014704]|uniref:Uncharacterized protein n=1 Tax=Leifsonia virtsii TaxID=3035915 RepID=A0ABT8J2H9_9MICO|nr:hypothetical protein [Leifsonia virtsii]MDN4599288.1 hypothetical protein [Leifsonia virtsii]
MHELKTVATIILAAVFVLRTASAIREPRSRLSWLASGVGTLALLTLGTVIPQRTIDGWLGGENWINLAQNVLCTVAFWLVTQAAISQDGQRRRLRWWPLVLALIAFIIPFLFITERGATDSSFIPHHTGQTAMWLYASIYMATIAAISFELLRGVATRPARAYWFFRVGAALVILASVDEIVYLTLARFQMASLAVILLLNKAFDPFFYIGVILIVVGIASFTAARSVRALRLQVKLFLLGRILARRGLQSPRSVPSTDTLGRVYDHVITIRDLETMDEITLSRTEVMLVDGSERLVASSLHNAPRESMVESLTITNGAPA